MARHGSGTGSSGPDIDTLARTFEAAYRAEAGGDLDAAVAAYRAALALDPEDRGGALLRLAAMGLAPTPDRAPPAYVATLFDENAEEFDTRLVDDLGYRVPEQLAASVAEQGLPAAARALDLGCGTGLVGRAVRGMVGHLTGVDLSAEMLLQAKRRQIYDRLMLGDVVAALEAIAARGEPPADLILGADLLIYIGRVEPLFEAAAAVLAPGGLLAVSTETLRRPPPGTWRWRVGEGSRFSHAPDYVADAARGAGLSVERLEPITVRQQADHPVPGHLLLARRPGA
ncbi:class I SAM-dependent methyltransferase [Paralimibaculum aggregatum]|uniref:Class I SAM-dependent methyltransferase n=1 Tax=Paralimibaculum aggregatum TaxID=3036245 RepID=A0ABQ6LKN8_9RHOB|nr:methyltransferase [Limibaculum sp. NKW23]GMG81353.1 class I SAM-dependent methyltransferase [Limibaculum sp. NKW23]